MPRVSRGWSRLAAISFAVLLASGATKTHAQGAFYSPTSAEVAGQPGTLIRDEAMSGAPLEATARRILYRSTDPDGEVVPVSGVVIVPPGNPLPGGFPIVAWSHPTSGLVPRCAPSLALFFFQQVQGLRDLVEHRYVVVATDYPGLGTPEIHPYLVGVSEGRAVLDAVRAARSLLGPAASNRMALWGHSQGGQASLYAASLAATYAPELELTGVAVAAPATRLDDLMEADLATSGGKNLLAMTLWSWSKYYGAPIDQVVLPEALPHVDHLAGVCLESPIDMPAREAVGKELEKAFLSVNDLTDLEPWKSLLAENTIGNLPPSIPIFIAQGTADNTVDPSVTAAYVAALCAAKSNVATLSMPGVGHALAAMHAATPAIAWIGDRFAGKPAPTSCAGQ